jgi:hypothetical protein
MTQIKIVKQRALKAKTNRVNKPKQIKPQKPITKAARVRNMRDLIKKLGRGIIPKEHSSFNHFYELIQRHPKNKSIIGVGIQAFKIEYNYISSRTNTIILIRTDGSRVLFGWNENNWNKTPKRLLTEAMRNAIEPTSTNYKNEQTELICCICKNDKLEFKDYHVDHKIIPFSRIRDAFLKEYDYESIRSFIPKSFDTSYRGFTLFKEKDSGFEEEWIYYHNVFYNHPEDYQILCQPCNSKKGNK